jgi:small subunit ribosomal protein S17
VGVVVSDKMDKTIVVAVENFRRHRIYKKVLRRTARYKAHDATNDASVGDVVRIEESRPLSRLKRWRLAEVVERHEVAETKPVEIDQSVVEELEERHKQVVEQVPATIEKDKTEVAELEEVGEIAEATAPDEEPGAAGQHHAQEPAEGSVEAGNASAPEEETVRGEHAQDPAEGSVESIEGEVGEPEAADDEADKK